MIKTNLGHVGVRFSRAFSDQPKPRMTVKEAWTVFSSAPIGVVASIVGGTGLAVYAVGSARWQGYTTESILEEKLALDHKVIEEKLASNRKVIEEKLASNRKVIEELHKALEEKIESERRLAEQREHALEEKAEKIGTLNYLKFAHSKDYASLRKNME